MPNLLRLFCLMLTSFALAACGGGESGTSDTDRKADEPDPRAGYFHSAESAKLNPRLAKFNKAWTAYQGSGNACNKEAARLYAAGASPRASVKCHLQEVGAMVRGTTAVRPALKGLKGDYRAACDQQIKRFGTTLDKLIAAWQRYYEDWTTYAKAGAVPAGIQQHARTANLQGHRFAEKAVTALVKACYIKSDIAESQG